MKQGESGADDRIAEFFKDVFSKNMKEYKDDVIDDEKFKTLSEEKRKMLHGRRIPEKNQILDVKEISNQMPVLHYINKKLRGKPFKGKRLIIVLHFLKDIIPFLKCCEKCGLEPSETLLFYKEYLYPHRELITKYLELQNYKNIHSLNSADEVLHKIQETWRRNEKPILIIEDGGYIVPKVHTKFPTIGKSVIGAVEQTTKGENVDRELEKSQGLYFPVLSVAGSTFKSKYEPPHIAREVVTSIHELMKQDLTSRSALVIGYGRIGSRIAEELQGRMNVTVTDKDLNALAGASAHGFSVIRNIEEAVRSKFLVICATGATEDRPIGRSELLAMNHETNLVSASSDQLEISLNDLEALAKTSNEIWSGGKRIGTRYIIRNTNKAINLIADGFPVNFWCRESMPNEVSDLIQALIFVTAIELAQNYEGYEKEVDSDVVNRITDDHEIAEIYLELREKT